MYDIFGADWSGTMVIVIVAVALYLFFAVYYGKNIRAKQSVGLVLAGIIFLVTFIPVVETIFVNNYFFGLDGAFLLSVFIMFGALIAVIREYIELTTSEPI